MPHNAAHQSAHLVRVLHVCVSIQIGHRAVCGTRHLGYLSLDHPRFFSHTCARLTAPLRQVGLIIAQYTCLFLASSTLNVDSPTCQPGTYNGAHQGWAAGVCFTQEQIWCRAHPSKNVNCPTADCRAEEIRLSLWRRTAQSGAVPPRTPVYSGCSAGDVSRIWDHVDAMRNPGDVGRYGRWAQTCGMCVPADDPRALYLPTCSEDQARCRGLYFRPAANSTATTWECGQQPIDYESVRSGTNDYFGCSG